MSVRVAVNGFGRIGRCALRVAANDSDIEFVALNDLTDAKTLAHLLKFDSIHGRFDGEVSNSENSITVNGKEIPVFSERDPANLPWKDKNVDVVLECTGYFRDRAGASKHLEAGAKKVIISAPAKEPDITVAIGINTDEYDSSKHNILSNASCTTNCLAPIAKVLLDNFGIKKGLMTTIHSYTNDQRILDLPHSDLRRARAAALNMIPTTTGAAKAVALVLPALKGKLDGVAIRVPTSNVSIVDLCVELEKEASKADINNAMKDAANGSLKGVLEYSEDPLVSMDLMGNPHSSIFDSGMTQVLGEKGTFIKVFSWYDNEWGFSNRIMELTKLIAK